MGSYDLAANANGFMKSPTVKPRCLEPATAERLSY